MAIVLKINEAKLRDIVAEAVKSVLNEDVQEFDNVNNEDIDSFNGHYTSVVVPEHCICYFANGDMEGYEDEEIQAMQKFEDEWSGKLRNGMNIGDVCIPLDDREPSFTSHNDVYGNIGCDCYKFLVPLK